MSAVEAPDTTGWTEEPGIVGTLLVSPDGLTVYSRVRGRTYNRRFSHAKAREWRALGFTSTEIARTFGVTKTAVEIAIDHEMRLLYHGRACRAQMSGTCELCGTATVSASHRKSADGRMLCQTCRGATKRTGIRFTADGEPLVSCQSCGEFKTADVFCAGTRYRDVRDGGFSNQCRPCLSAARAAYRNRHRVPCDGGCGRMVEGKGRGINRGAPDRPHLCRRCWHDRRSHA